MNQKFKTNFNFVFNIVIIASILMFGFVWADSNGIWTYAEDIRAGTFGSDEGGGEYTFSNQLNVEGRFNATDEVCVNDECHMTWGEVCSSWVVTNSVN